MMTSSRTELLPASRVKVDVETKAARFSFACAGDETLLTAGLAAGYDLPYECSTGTCATCHARVMSGDVDPGWPEAPGYSKLSIAKGDVLMCQARPSSDCAIRVRSGTPQPETPAAVLLRRKGRVASSRRLTGDVMHFEVDLDAPMRFVAGQFVGLRHPAVTGVRAYSMVNHAEETGRLHFVIKRKPDGLVSDALFEADPAGIELDIIGPLGRATFRPDEGRDIVCIAGGSGIAGMMAMLDHASRIGWFTRHEARLFFGVRRQADAFYLAEMAAYVAGSNGGLEVVVAFSHEAAVPERHAEHKHIRLAEGLVHEVAAREMRGAWGSQIAYVAGPQPMVDAAIRVLLTEARLKPGDIRFDKFS